MANILNNLVIDVNETVGNKLLLLEVRPYASYKEGVKGEQEGLTFTCLSERMNFEKIDVKIAGILKPPFDFNGKPVPVELEGLDGRLWQDWSNRGTVKLSLTATGIRQAETKRIKLGE